MGYALDSAVGGAWLVCGVGEVVLGEGLVFGVLSRLWSWLGWALGWAKLWDKMGWVGLWTGLGCAVGWSLGKAKLVCSLGCSELVCDVLV